MQGKMMFIHGLSPIHSGTGQSVDVVDLPVAREKTTGWPYVPGSSIKGVLRDVCEPPKGADRALFVEAFGPDTSNAADSAGSLLFCDAHLLCLPVRSFYGTFAWVTCPAILERLKRDCESAGVTCSIPALTTVVKEAEVAVSKSNKIATKGGKVFLEDIDLAVIADADASGIAEPVAKAVFPGDKTAIEWDKTAIEAFIQRFAVISDDMFATLSETATEVVARIKIKDETKTVQEGGLWYEESIPTEAILWAPLLAASRKSKPDVLFGLLDDVKIVQIGGHASVGRGLVRVILASEVC